MKRDQGRQNEVTSMDQAIIASRGFSLLELTVIVAVSLIGTAIAVPVVGSAVRSYKARSAALNVAGAISTTRYRAIAAGYPYQLVFSAANSNYVIQSDPNTTTNFANIPAQDGNGPGPFLLSGSSVAAKLGQDTILSFNPSGSVRSTINGVTAACTSAAATNPCVLALTYNNLTETISVTGLGNVNVNP
jgi:Tfp pilus assembly protein FimT